MTAPSSSPRGERPGRPGARWNTTFTTTERYVPDGTPAPRPNRADRRAAMRAHNQPKEQPMTFPDVQGRCPACHATSLFLGAGGHVTCSRLECPDPCAADELLHGEHDDVVRCGASMPGAGQRPDDA